MVVAVMFSRAEKECIEANRRTAKNDYRDAFMARGPRGKVSRLEIFQQPSRNLPVFIYSSSCLTIFKRVPLLGFPDKWEPEVGAVGESSNVGDQ